MAGSLQWVFFNNFEVELGLILLLSLFLWFSCGNNISCFEFLLEAVDKPLVPCASRRFLVTLLSGRAVYAFVWTVPVLIASFAAGLQVHPFDAFSHILEACQS